VKVSWAEVSYPVWAWPLKPSVGMKNPADHVTARSFDVWNLEPANSVTHWLAMGVLRGCSILSPEPHSVERTT
jgi:hypothetical protein